MFPWKLSRSRVESIWKPAGLKAPVKQPKSGRSCLDDGSCIQLRPEYANHCLELGLRHNMTFKDIAEGAALLCLLRAISTCTSITKPIQNQAFVPRVVECIPVSTRWFKPPRAGGGGHYLQKLYRHYLLRSPTLAPQRAQKQLSI